MSVNANLIPMVIDHNGRGERAYDIYSLLLKERIVFLSGPIGEQSANLVVAQLLYLNSQSQSQPIDLYIHSPGGAVYAGLAIYDAMQMISAPVSTISVGFTGSMATGLLASGAKGKRFALPHATVHMHPASGGARGYTEDVRIATHEQERLQIQLFHILGRHCGRRWQEIEEMFERDRYMNAVEAKSVGLIDDVLGDANDLVFLKKAAPELVNGESLN